MANRLTSASDAHDSQSPPQWKADQLLQLIHRFNSHCIGVIGRAVAERSRKGSAHIWCGRSSASGRASRHAG